MSKKPAPTPWRDQERDWDKAFDTWRALNLQTRKATTEQIVLLIECLREGMPRSQAAATAGLHYRAVLRWMESVPSFAAVVGEAETEPGRKALETFIAATKTDWKAALEFLKRRWPLEWGDKLTLNPKDLSDEQLLFVIDRLRTGGAAPGVGGSPDG